MSKARWNKYSDINSKILRILTREDTFLNTAKIKRLIYEKYWQKLSLKTVQKYLYQMLEAGHIKIHCINKTTKVYHFWAIVQSSNQNVRTIEFNPNS